MDTKTRCKTVSTHKPFHLNLSANTEKFNVGFIRRATYGRENTITLVVEVIALTKNEYKHFNPVKYDIPVKIATVKASSHSKHNINYHIIWIPKYRKKLLEGKVRDVLSQIIEGQCEELNLQMLALEIMPDHIHLFVAGLPTHTPYKIVHKLKGNTSIQLRRCFRDVRYLGYKQHFGRGFKNLWARGYYCGSAGHVSQESVKRYILEQQGKDVFEYSVFGNPQKKIGEFYG